MAPRLAARRREQDRLIDAVADALATRATALAALETSRSSLDEAVAALAEHGVDRDRLAALLGVPAHDLSPEAGRRPGGAPATGTETGEVRRADAGEPGGPARLWLAMIERGPAPKTHGLERDGWLLCRGIGDAEHLATWVGYAFDVDCQRCARLLAQQLTDEELG